MTAGAPTKSGLDRITKNNPVRLNVVTVATAPNASANGAGSVIFVSNGSTGTPCLAVSDGTNWKVVDLGSNIAAS